MRWLPLLALGFLIGMVHGFAAHPRCADTIHRVMRSCALLETDDAYGSCFCLRYGDNTELVTCQHVTAGSRVGVLRCGSREFPATVVREDAGLDLSLLRSNVEMPALRLAGERPAVGDRVLTCGNPLGMRDLTMLGTVAEEGERTVGADGVEVQALDLTSCPGQSGSPVCDSTGRVVGVLEAHMHGTHVGLMVPLWRLKQFLEER